MLARSPTLESGIRAFTEHSDLLLVLGVVMVLVMIVIPVPPFLLDLLLVFNITTSLVILLVAMYTLEPLQFSVFPGLLLIVTLFRLSMNVAATRLILSEAYAGEVINAFGSFVVKGNYVVGMVIFLIIIVIQFVVITKGATRIAEVAARFTLDAMPGKQMAIDADLNAGLLDEQEARRRREKIGREADFYGAMDGASKFVRGDAVAGLVIILIDIIGGLIVGVLQKGMTIGNAAQIYTRLTVGDGLVLQIPALIVSTAAGLIVTRAASEAHLGHDLTRQLLAQPRAIFIASGLLFLFGIIPGLPMLPFFVLGIIAGVIAYTTQQADRLAVETRLQEEQLMVPREEERVEDYLEVDPLVLEIGYSLIPLVDEERGGDLPNRIGTIRRRCAVDLGIIIPPIRIRDNVQLRPSEYVIKIRSAEVDRGEVMIGYYLALNPGAAEGELDGIDTREPTFGLPAKWITEAQKERAERLGYTVVKTPAVIVTHLMEVIRSNAHQILRRQDTQNLIDNAKKKHPTVVDELIPNLMTVGAVQKVLQALLKERVPIKDMVLILETLADQAPMVKDINLLVEYVRTALSHTISELYETEKGRIASLILDPRLEGLIADLIEQAGTRGETSVFPPELLGRLYDNLTTLLEPIVARGQKPIVICSPQSRPIFRRLTEQMFPNLVVLSYAELSPKVQIEQLGIVNA